MIKRSNGELGVECNECGAELWGGCTDDFQEFIEELKRDGWKIQRNEGEWEHICSDCREDE